MCAKADFEAVVDDAAGALRDLNLQNKPAFQEKLRQLKDKRGWSHDAFLKEAAPFVRDDKIAVYDQEFGAAADRHLDARAGGRRRTDARLRAARRLEDAHEDAGRYADGKVDLYVLQARRRPGAVSASHPDDSWLWRDYFLTQPLGPSCSCGWKRIL